jgi:tetratricopeptide (TPR) repeat protein
MKDPIQNIELIERYFDDEMSESEKQEFIDRVKNDLELRHLFDRERLLINTARLTAARNNLEFLKDLDKTLPAVNIESKKSPSLYYAVAASVVLLIAVGIFVFNSGGTSPAKLYAEYYSPLPNVIDPTVRGAQSESLLTESVKQYEQGNYTEAAEGFKKLLQQDPDAHMSAYLFLQLGVCYMAVDNMSEAKANLEKARASGVEVRTTATWYLALCLLKENNVSQAKVMLQEIPRDHVDYGEPAQELLDKLK